jgi:hypothetical protein
MYYIRYKLADIIVIGFTALLYGYEDYGEMEEFGRLRQDLFKGFLELPNGIPDESAFRRIMGYLNPLGLQKGLENRLADIKMRPKEENETVRLVNIDRKRYGGADFTW